MTAVLAAFLNHSLTTIPALFALPSMASRSVGVKRTTKETLRVMAFLGRPRVRFFKSVPFSFANFFIGKPPQVTDCDHREQPPFPTPQCVGKRFFALQKNKLAPYRATKVYLWRTDGGLHLFPVVFPAIFPTETATYLLMQISS